MRFKTKERKEWEPWFAWFSVNIDGEMVWLETVERKIDGIPGYGFYSLYRWPNAKLSYPERACRL